MFKIKEQTDLTELYSLNEYQKSFTNCVNFKVILIDNYNIKVEYYIPENIVMFMDFDLNGLDKEISKALAGKSANYITTYLIVMQIIMKDFNSRQIGICMDKEIEELMLEQIRRENDR